MDYHVMTKELYPHGYLLETRGFFANDKMVSLHSSFPDNPHSIHPVKTYACPGASSCFCTVVSCMAKCLARCC